MKSLEVEFQRAKRYKLPFSILLMDIDYFKMINDTYGHLGGDEVLKNTGKLIQNVFRSTDIAGRFGGEEFCIILPSTKKDDALLAGEKFRKSVENSVTQFNEKKIRFTCSIGITEYMETDSNFSVLIERADTALYSAKREGRNRIIIS